MRITRSALTDSDLRIHLNTVETVGDRDVAVPEPDPVGEEVGMFVAPFGKEQTRDSTIKSNRSLALYQRAP